MTGANNAMRRFRWPRLAVTVLCAQPSLILADGYPSATVEQATYETMISLTIDRYAGLDELGMQAEYQWALDMARLCLENPELLARDQLIALAVEFQRHAGRTARHRGFIEQGVGDYETAIDYVYESERLLAGTEFALKPQRWVESTLRDIADAYVLMGAYGTAASLSNRIIESVQTYSEGPVPSPPELIRLANIAERTGHFDEAADLLDTVRQWHDQVRIRALVERHPELTRVEGNKPWSRTVRDPDVQAMLSKRHGLDLRDANVLREDHTKLARALRISGRLEDASYALETAALTPWKVVDLHRARLDWQLDREWAFLALTRGDPEEALERARACLDKYVMGQTDRVELIELVSRALEQLAHLQAAFDKLKEAIEIVETRRANLFQDANKQSFVASYAPLYRRALDLVIRIHGGESKEAIERSFEWSERIKGRAMLDTLNRYGRRMARAAARGDVDAMQRIQDLTGKVTSIEDLQKGKWWPKKTALLEYTYNGIGKANGAQVSNVVHLWMVTAKNTSYHRLPTSSDEIDRTCQALTQALRQCESKNDSWVESASQLYQMLIAPVADQLSGMDRLVVVGDGMLLTTPFEVFVTARDARPHRPVKHELLIDDFAISYAPSATLLNQISIKPRPKDWQQSLWAFASTKFKESGGAPERSPTLRGYKEILRAARTLKLDDLRNTAAEVEEIVSIVGSSRSRTFVDQPHMKNRLLDASRKGTLRSVRFLHFATHAIVDSDRPYLSGLVLCPPYPQTDGVKDSNVSLTVTRRKGDGRGSTRRQIAGAGRNSARPELLSLVELASLDLGAELVVLSACKSLGERAVAGDWVQGLTRAILVAGGSGVVCSAWDTSDWQATGFMPALYESLVTTNEELRGDRASPNAPIDVPRALQQLKTALMESPSLGHPSHWASWVYYGKVGAAAH